MNFIIDQINQEQGPDIYPAPALGLTRGGKSRFIFRQGHLLLDRFH
jgi:hypothetical protein